MNMSARTKLETFEEVYNRKLTAAEAYANRPRKWMLYTLIVLIIVVMVSWSSSSIQFNGMTTTGSEVAKGVLHGVFNPDTKLLFGTGDTDVPYLLLQTVAIAVLGTLFGAILAIPFAFLAASNIMPKPISYLFRLLILLIIVIAGVGTFAFVHSIRTRRRQLYRLAYVDPLTNGDNFACFKEKLSHRGGDSGFYVALDLQDFKLINNTCGVAKGDETLLEVWKILQTGTHLGEFSAHINADRFILFLRDNDRCTLEPRLECLCQDISNLSTKLNIPKLFPLCGIYETADHKEIEQNYGKAVQAMYPIKGKRTRHYAFYDELDIKQLSEDRLMEDVFEDALKNGEFQLWYQPKVDPVTGNILGAEALIRWKRPDGTMLSPGKFIPLFEKNGNITTLDEYVFRTVCAQQQRWLQAGAKLYPISVNISRVSLYYSNVVDKYREILNSFRLDPKYVPLEITESATIDNSDISSLIEQFHEAGFTLLLDDFGSGYSSLSSLNVMHFDTIKLDKSLIDYIGDRNGEKLLLHITQLLQSFGMTITAEGVETSDQVEFLKNLHCDDIQGYYFSKPLPVNEFEDFVRKHTGL